DARAVADFDGRGLRNLREVRHVLRDCDVVLSAETFYDDRLLVNAPYRTALVGNREFLDWVVRPEKPRPDLFIAPSTWRLDEWPQPTVFLPHPVDRERLPFQERHGTRTFLHVTGPATDDRAGTRLVLDAARLCDARIVVKTQYPLKAPVLHPRRVRVVTTDVENYWNVYAGADVLLAPRRYGGQSLPVVEAQSLGMPVVGLDRLPERELLPAELRVPARVSAVLQTPGGSVNVWDAQPEDLAKVVTWLTEDDDAVRRLSQDSDRRASEVSWGILEPRWRGVLEGLAR
ncbi:MAG: glycosyltransferase, partial [Actinomycetota bacterium]